MIALGNLTIFNILSPSDFPIKEFGSKISGDVS